MMSLALRGSRRLEWIVTATPSPNTSRNLRATPHTATARQRTPESAPFFLRCVGFFFSVAPSSSTSRNLRATPHTATARKRTPGSARGTHAFHRPHATRHVRSHLYNDQFPYAAPGHLTRQLRPSSFSDDSLSHPEPLACLIGKEVGEAAVAVEARPRSGRGRGLFYPNPVRTSPNLVYSTRSLRSCWI
jgi:hypothetical protein